jgi:hypothetical protein
MAQDQDKEGESRPEEPILKISSGKLGGSTDIGLAELWPMPTSAFHPPKPTRRPQCLRA